MSERDDFEAGFSAGWRAHTSAFTRPGAPVDAVSDIFRPWAQPSHAWTPPPAPPGVEDPCGNCGKPRAVHLYSIELEKARALRRELGYE